MVLDCLFQTTRKIFMLQYSNAHRHVRPKGKSGWEISQHETIVSGGRNYRYRNSASTRTLTIARAIHNFLRPGTFCRLCLAIAADQRSYTSVYIYICIYLYNLFVTKEWMEQFLNACTCTQESARPSKSVHRFALHTQRGTKPPWLAASATRQETRFCSDEAKIAQNAYVHFQFPCLFCYLRAQQNHTTGFWHFFVFI